MFTENAMLLKSAILRWNSPAIFLNHNSQIQFIGLYNVNIILNFGFSCLHFLCGNAVLNGRRDRAEARLWCPVEALVMQMLRLLIKLINFFAFS